MENYSVKRTAKKAIKYPAIVLIAIAIADAVSGALGLDATLVQAIGVIVPILVMGLYDALKHKVGIKLP